MPDPSSNRLICNHPRLSFTSIVNKSTWTLLLITGVTVADNTVQLDEVTVFEFRSSADTYKITLDSHTANWSTADWLSLGHSTTVFDATYFDANTADRIEDIASLKPGLTASSRQAGYNTALSIRGFHTVGETFLNNHRDNTHFLIRDLATVDQVEVLHGHNSILYGAGSPAGTINYISKRPFSQDYSSISLIAGNDHFLRGEVDLSKKLNNSGSLAGRMVAASQDGDTLYNNVSNKRWTVFPSLQWNYGQNGSVRLELEQSGDTKPYYFGTIYTDGKIYYDQSYVFPEARADKQFGRAGLYWKHRINDTISFRADYSHSTTDRDDKHAGFFFKRDDESLYGYYRLVNEEYTQNNLKLEVMPQFRFRDISHHLLLGAEYNKSSSDVDSNRNIGGYTLDIENPDFNVNLSALELSHRRTKIDDKDYGLYITDRIIFSPHFELDAGMRHSEYESRVDSSTTTASTTSDNTTFSSSLTAIWKPTNDSSFHAALSESFYPNTGTDKDGNFFDPKEAQQLELGFRRQLQETNDALEVTFYQLTQKNIPETDPDDRDFKILSGEQSSLGVELRYGFALRDNLSFTIGYAYIDAEFTKNSSGYEGNTPPSVPRHSGDLRFSYQPEHIPALHVFGGITAIDERYGDKSNSFEIPGYGLVDIGASYSNQNLITKFTVTNLFDKRYIAVSFMEDDIYQGNRLAAKLSLKYVF